MTLEQLIELGFVEHHKCGGCGAAVGYQMHPDVAAAVFNSSCDCVPGQTFRLVSWEELQEIPEPQAAEPTATAS